MQFPDDGEFEIRDLDFDAKILPPGAATLSFRISVSVTTAKGAKPAAFVLRPNQPEFNERGSASLEMDGETAKLEVSGSDPMGQSLQLTIVCGPKKKQ